MKKKKKRNRLKMFTFKLYFRKLVKSYVAKQKEMPYSQMI